MAGTEIRPQAGPQEAFLATEADIAIYGGAAGGGKSWRCCSNRSATSATRTSARSSSAATASRSATRAACGTRAPSSTRWSAPGRRRSILQWQFPSGAKLKFAHLEHEKTKYDWQGSQIPLIGFDELTHFSRSQFLYMLSRNRSTCGVRPYIRATTNPDADSWVADFIAW